RSEAGPPTRPSPRRGWTRPRRGGAGQGRDARRRTGAEPGRRRCEEPAEERMPPEPTHAPGAGWPRLASAALPATIVGAILVFVVPVPAAALDLLLAANITLAVRARLAVLAV